MKILNVDRSELAAYVCAQLNQFFPTGEDAELGFIDACMDEALARLEHCIAEVRMWRQGEFDVLQSSQYCTFLYFLANTIWRREQARRVCTKLFLLNKTLNGIDCFYEIEMPNVFFIGHSVGIVLAKATYGEHFVVYQNSTVGKNHGVAPIIGHGVVMYPNTAIIGSSHVRDGSVLSQGVSIINQETPGNCMVFRGSGASLEFKPAKRNVLADIFRIDDAGG
jgi:serine O-acetyltransferase